MADETVALMVDGELTDVPLSDLETWDDASLEALMMDAAVHGDVELVENLERILYGRDVTLGLV